MRPATGVRRVIVVVLDGLRADAIPLFPLPVLADLAATFAATLSARTVTPSVTAACMTSLLTGVAPRAHGVTHDRFGIPPHAGRLLPLPHWLARHGVASWGFMAALPRAFRGVGARIAGRLGATITFAGSSAAEILEVARPVLSAGRTGLVLMHWPDADQAGHARGWTSEAYARAARGLDQAVGRLLEMTGVGTDPGTVLLLLADHGGGGRRLDHHDSGHPLDTTIPLILVGGQVVAGELPSGISLLDVSATIPWLFGLPVPAGYEGRVLAEAMPGEPAGRPIMERVA